MRKSKKLRTKERSYNRASFRDRLVNSVDLPLETICNLSQMQILGDQEVTLEGYKGILEYNDNFLRIKVKGMSLAFWGSELQLKSMNDDNIIITGKLEQIEFLTEASDHKERKVPYK